MAIEMNEKRSNKSDLNSCNVRNDLQSTSNGSNSLSLKKDKNFENNLRNFATIDDSPEKQSRTMEYCALSLIFVLFLIFIGSSLATFVLWFTNVYHEFIVENLALKNNTKALDWWIDPPIEPLFKVHVFNYTNVEDFLNGKDEKLKVQDMGPYVYREKIAKANLTFEDYLITYQENRTQTFMSDLTGKWKGSDPVVVPNVFGISAYEKAGFMGSLVKGWLTSTNSGIFNSLTVDEFLWGYTDGVIAKAREFSSSIDEYFGMFRTRKGVNKETLTVHTGEDDVNNLGKLHAFEGQIKMKNMWKSNECNYVNGSSDGSQFPPYLIDAKEPVEIFIKGFCRKFPLVFDSETTVLNGIPVYRYKPPSDVFTKNNPNNKCYQIDYKYAYDGLLNVAPCFGDAPLFVSYPHFYKGDPYLIDQFEGLNPNEEEHGTIADIHPKLAFPIHGHSRFQINILLKRRTLDRRVQKDIILPVVWLEVTSGKIPDEFMELVKEATFSTHDMYMYFQYGSLATVIASLFLIIMAFMCYLSVRRTPSIRPTSDIVVTLEKK